MNIEYRTPSTEVPVEIPCLSCLRQVNGTPLVPFSLFLYLYVMKQAPARNVDDYIALQPVEQRKRLEELRRLILKCAPKAEELISYSMPAYKLNGILVYFAAYPKHYGFYALPTANKEFKERLKPYKTGKGSIQFPWDEPLPKKLIIDMLKFRVKENLAKRK